MTRKLNQRSPANFLKILACPKCGGNIDLKDTSLNCKKCKIKYPIHDGVPIFLSDPQDLKVMPHDHVSNQPPPRVIELLNNLEGIALHIGAGATDVKIPHCIELENSLYKNTDVVADAHYLPFLKEVFDIVVSFAVFEHLYDPVKAAGEVFRVLKPGGKLIIHSAFLSPLHMEPVHYFNATKYGMCRWFSDFKIEKCEVSPNFHPILTLAWLIHDFLYFIKEIYGMEGFNKIADTTFDHWRKLWINKTYRNDYIWDMLADLPQYVQQRFSTGFELEAIKPLKLSYDRNVISSDSHLNQLIDYHKDRAEQLNFQIEQLLQKLAWQEAQTAKWWEKTQKLQLELTQQKEEAEKWRSETEKLQIK